MTPQDYAAFMRHIGCADDADPREMRKAFLLHCLPHRGTQYALDAKAKFQRVNRLLPI